MQRRFFLLSCLDLATFAWNSRSMNFRQERHPGVEWKPKGTTDFSTKIFAFHHPCSVDQNEMHQSAYGFFCYSFYLDKAVVSRNKFLRFPKSVLLSLSFSISAWHVNQTYSRLFIFIYMVHWCRMHAYIFQVEKRDELVHLNIFVMSFCHEALVNAVFGEFVHAELFFWESFRLACHHQYISMLHTLCCFWCPLRHLKFFFCDNPFCIVKLFMELNHVHIYNHCT